MSLIRTNGKQLLVRLNTCLMIRSQQLTSTTTTTTTLSEENEIKPVELKQPLKWSSNVKLTKAIESKEEFKHVLKLLPQEIVPQPPSHSSYPTPSGWQPPNYEKAKKLPYAVLRTRSHNFPIYLEEREGGSRKLVRIKNIQGDIWVGFFFYRSLGSFDFKIIVILL